MELTQEQKDQFPAFLDRWLAHGLSTDPARRDDAERGVRIAYREADFPEPQEIAWLRSPLAGAIFDTCVQRLQSEQPKGRARGETKTYSDQVMGIVREVLPLLQQYFGAKRVSEKFILSSLDDLVLYNASYGQHDASILCFYDFFAQVCGVEDCKRLEGLNLVAQAAGWWWAYDTLAIITERPSKLSLDDRGRLHSDADWAILYPDGFGFCVVHGVQVPPRIIFQSSEITTQEIDSETNAEVRRVMIERYGQARYIQDSGASLLGKDDWGELYRKEVPDDEPMLMVKVVNSTQEPDGTFRDYWLRVPPTIRTAREGVAWTFAVEKEAAYAPEVET